MTGVPNLESAAIYIFSGSVQPDLLFFDFSSNSLSATPAGLARNEVMLHEFQQAICNTKMDQSESRKLQSEYNHVKT